MPQQMDKSSFHRRSLPERLECSLMPIEPQPKAFEQVGERFPGMLVILLLLTASPLDSQHTEG